MALQVRSISQRYAASGLLLFAAVSTICGFILITTIGIINYWTKRNSVLTDEPYKSGYGYWPATVSEMVHDRESVGGKLFYTIAMIAGMCLFISYYPYNLRNVYTGNEKVPRTSIYWITFRQLCPSMGLWLLIGINTYPTPVALASTGKTKLFCVLLHLAGAGFFFLGYTICEMKCLDMRPFKRKADASDPGFLKIEGKEFGIRRALAQITIVGFLGFLVMQALLMFSKKLDICCVDDWRFGFTDVHGKKRTVPQVLDTAHGTVFYFKVLSFVFEDMAGVALVLSHFSIWYFCEERHMNQGVFQLREVHPQPDDEPELPQARTPAEAVQGQLAPTRSGTYHIS